MLYLFCQLCFVSSSGRDPLVSAFLTWEGYKKLGQKVFKSLYTPESREMQDCSLCFLHHVETLSSVFINFRWCKYKRKASPAWRTCRSDMLSFFLSGLRTSLPINHCSSHRSGSTKRGICSPNEHKKALPCQGQS